MSEQRKELMPHNYELPSNFWQPQPDEEDLKRMEQEYKDDESYNDDPLPFE